jgi:hypothetical protein
MYASPTCAHCRAELERWAKLIAQHQRAFNCIEFLVATAPRNASEPPSWLPRSLPATLIRDEDGRIGRALHATLVPTTVYVTPRATVVARIVGESSDERSLKTISLLSAATAREQGGRP